MREADSEGCGLRLRPLRGAWHMHTAVHHGDRCSTERAMQPERLVQPERKLQPERVVHRERCSRVQLEIALQLDIKIERAKQNSCLIS